MRADASTMRHARGKEQWLLLSELPEDDFTKPATWLVDEVKKHGVVVPLIVADYGDDGYRVIDGRRRLAAARAIGLDKVPARVFDGDEIEPELAVLLNTIRANNWTTAYETVRDMALSGKAVEEIGDRTGLTVPTVKALLAVTSAHPTVLKAMRAGTVRYSVVRQVARLNRELQDRLVRDCLFTRGTITAKDVRTAVPPPVQQELPEAWRVRAWQTLDQLAREAPETRPNTRALLEAARDAIGTGRARHLVEVARKYKPEGQDPLPVGW